MFSLPFIWFQKWCQGVLLLTQLDMHLCGLYPSPDEYRSVSWCLRGETDTPRRWR